MSKVALITLHTVSNYGSCLQTFATQKYLNRSDGKLRLLITIEQIICLSMQLRKHLWVEECRSFKVFGIGLLG